MSAEAWRCDVHHLQVPDGDCPKCDDELIALTEQDVDADRPYARRTFAEVLEDYVLVRGDLTAAYAREQLVREHEARLAEVERDRQAEEDRANANATLVHELRRQIEALVAKANAGADAWGACSHEWARIADLEALVTWNAEPTAGPVDWDSPTWGGGRHEAAWAPDGTHDDNAQDD